MELLLGKQLKECSWPTYNADLLISQDVTITIQVGGKVRGIVQLPKGAEQKTVEEIAASIVARWLRDGKQLKVVFVPDRLINFVLKV